MPPLELEDPLDPTYQMDQQTLNLKFSHLSTIISKFETVFQREYLTALRERNYGNNPPCTLTPIKVGDVVLIESNSSREWWPLGRVIKLLPDPDGIVRAVTMYSRGVESVRTLDKLVNLEILEPALPVTEGEAVIDSENEESEEVLVPRPRRAASQRATELNRQLYLEDRA